MGLLPNWSKIDSLVVELGWILRRLLARMEGSNEGGENCGPQCVPPMTILTVFTVFDDFLLTDDGRPNHAPVIIELTDGRLIFRLRPAQLR